MAGMAAAEAQGLRRQFEDLSLVLERRSTGKTDRAPVARAVGAATQYSWRTLDRCRLLEGSGPGRLGYTCGTIVWASTAGLDLVLAETLEMSSPSQRIWSLNRDRPVCGATRSFIGSTGHRPTGYPHRGPACSRRRRHRLPAVFDWVRRRSAGRVGSI
jgi:hypothetical protein